MLRSSTPVCAVWFCGLNPPYLHLRVSLLNPPASIFVALEPGLSSDNVFITTPDGVLSERLVSFCSPITLFHDIVCLYKSLGYVLLFVSRKHFTQYTQGHFATHRVEAYAWLL